MIKVTIDASILTDIERVLEPVARKAMEDAAQRMVAMTRGKAIELANERLHTRRQMFIDGLNMVEVNDSTYLITLDADVRWIDDGLPQHNMIDNLLNSPKAKTAKDGSKYVVVPFRHGPSGPTQQTPAQSTLLNTIKGELKKRGIPYGKIESGADGSPKLGTLHKFSITQKPIKTSNSPGQGKGPVGEVMQGPTGIPLLQGIQIRQRMQKNKDGSESVKRDIMTFRVASSKHKDQGRWEHPGLQPMNIMEDTAKWAMETWEKEIAPGIIMELERNF